MFDVIKMTLNDCMDNEAKGSMSTNLYGSKKRTFTVKREAENEGLLRQTRGKDCRRPLIKHHSGGVRSAA